MGFNWWRDNAGTAQPGVSAQAIVERVQAEHRRERTRAQVTRATAAGMWPDGWPHEAPDHPLSVHEAHRAMQRHRNCLIDECPRKRAAWRTLIEAGKVRPDSGRTFGEIADDDRHES